MEEKAESDCLFREEVAELSYSESYSLDSLAPGLLSPVEDGDEDVDSPSQERNSQEDESVWCPAVLPKGRTHDRR